MTFSGIQTFCKNILLKSRYGLTEAECERAIMEACQFFGLPAPVVIRNMTEHPGGDTCFLDRDPESFYDDILCYNLQQLKRLGVDGYVGFSAIFTHECAHRLFQNRLLPGPDFGQWEHELVADYFMGVRAALQDMDITSVIDGLSQSRGSGTHPNGALRREYILYGKQEGYMHRIKKIVCDAEHYFKLFLEYRERHLEALRMAEMRVY
ncbi:MAG: hypothetical protein SPL12_09150 [Bacteroidales bacterium]|nr:hypothetical protein [Bacteroidales bacterium]